MAARQSPHVMTSANGMTRIQIDCGNNSSGHASANGMFASLPLARKSTAATATHAVAHALLPTHFSTREPASEAERELLLDGDDTTKQPKVVLLDRRTRLSVMCCSFACTLLTITIVVLLVLIYDRVNDTLADIDNSVSIAASTSTALTNMNKILNSTANVAKTVERLGGLTTPLLRKIVNTTQDTVDDIHRLVEHPTLHIGR
jgi:hypothetical protein